MDLKIFECTNKVLLKVEILKKVPSKSSGLIEGSELQTFGMKLINHLRDSFDRIIVIDSVVKYKLSENEKGPIYILRLLVSKEDKDAVRTKIKHFVPKK